LILKKRFELQPTQPQQSVNQLQIDTNVEKDYPDGQLLSTTLRLEKSVKGDATKPISKRQKDVPALINAMQHVITPSQMSASLDT
jgi:hypothetical protein